VVDNLSRCGTVPDNVGGYYAKVGILAFFDGSEEEL
jgi:hypothetical protein